VFCDLRTLSTLAREERIAGLAEVVKAAWIESDEAVRALERDAEALAGGQLDATERAVRASVRLKSEIVADDEHEAGRRRLLNLGHTFGHAIEAARGFVGVRHGEAVSLGMMVAFEVSAALGVEGAREHGERMRSLLRRLGLPTDWRACVDARVRAFLAGDKKRVGARLRFVVPGAPGRVEVVPLGLEEVRRMTMSA
jgi:3-dehydroquinate synthetase